MSITHVTALRDDLADAVAAFMLLGAGDATLELRDGTDVCVIFTLNATPFGAASSGVITANGVPIAAVATDDGVALDNFILKNQNGDAAITGSVTATGMGGDIEVTNINVANGQDCSLESLTYTAPV